MLVNVTPHELCLRRTDGATLVLPPSGQVARVATQDRVVDYVGWLPVHAMVLGDEVIGLPDPAPGTVYVASLLAAQAAAKMGREDVYAPGPAIRDADGRVVGADGLSRP